MIKYNKHQFDSDSVIKRITDEVNLSMSLTKDVKRAVLKQSESVALELIHFAILESVFVKGDKHRVNYNTLVSRKGNKLYQEIISIIVFENVVEYESAKYIMSKTPQK